jgi:hypothetical protein
MIGLKPTECRSADQQATVSGTRDACDRETAGPRPGAAGATIEPASDYRFDPIVSEAAALGARLGELQSSGRQMVGLLVSEAR